MSQDAPIDTPHTHTHKRHWLEHEGSPQSRVSNAIFRNERAIEALAFTDFDIRHD